MAIKNMWGDINTMDDIRPPHEIIEEQGVALSEMTKGLMDLYIEYKQTKTIYSYDIYVNLPSRKLRCLIFRLTHDFQLYPANLYDEQVSKEFKSQNQAEFEEHLGGLLSSKETMQTIGKLMAQARLGAKDMLV